MRILSPIWAQSSREHPLAVPAALLLILLVGCALMADFLTPYEPNETALAESLHPPSARHWFGTDKFGRDISTRILYGARVTLLAALLAQAITLTIGLTLGALAGYYQGRFADQLISWLMTVIWAFPFLLLVVAITASLGRGLVPVFVAVGLANWVGIARIVRGEVIALREREFVLASQALGVGRMRLVFRHILPNALPPVIVTTTLAFADVVMAEAGLSFLGLGVQPPTASWGEMIRTGAAYITTAWWQAFFPGLALVLTILSLNVLGDFLNAEISSRQ